MRTVRNIENIPKETDYAKFPDSTVINETSTSDGTPVVREIYGDLLTNVYNLLRITGVTPNEQEDNEDNGYQLVDALRKLTNNLNDSEYQLNLDGTTFSVNIDLQLLPNKYFLFARSISDYVATTTYGFKGTGIIPQFGFASPTGFKAGDPLLLILDQTGVRAYKIAASDAAEEPQVFTPFGAPLAFANGGKVWYQAEGVLYSDLPEAYDLQSSIRVLEGDGTALVYEMLQINAYLICLTYFPTTQRYKIHRFSLSGLSAPSVMAISGASFPVGTDNKPNIYTDGSNLYISNNTGNNANAFAFDVFSFDLAAGTLTKTGSVSLDSGFAKTTNAAIVNGKIYTFVSGILKSYSLTSGAESYAGSFPGNSGIVFRYGTNIYHSSGDVARKWSLS